MNCSEYTFRLVIAYNHFDLFSTQCTYRALTVSFFLTLSIYQLFAFSSRVFALCLSSSPLTNERQQRYQIPSINSATVRSDKLTNTVSPLNVGNFHFHTWQNQQQCCAIKGPSAIDLYTEGNSNKMEEKRGRDLAEKSELLHYLQHY